MKNFFLFPTLFVLCLTAFLKAETAERDLFPKDAVILFQGDSVTDGNRGRSADPNHIHGHGYVYLIASYLGATYPERNWTFVNRGVSGNKVSDLKNRWEKDTFEIHPDVLCIMIGVNDLGHGVTPEESIRRSIALLNAQMPVYMRIKRTIVRTEPFPRTSSGKIRV